MADFTKHRLETLEVAVSFASALNTGDTVASITSVAITRGGGSSWTDVSSEFGSPSGSLDGSTVTVTLEAADADEQARNEYTLRVTVTTAGGETLVATPTLEVTAVADPSQP